MYKKLILRNTLKITSVTLGLTLAAAATAAPQDRFPIDLQMLETQAAERFAEMDSNSDGQIDSAEFESAKMHHGPRGNGKHRHHHKRRPGPFTHGDAEGGVEDGPAKNRRQAMKAAVQAELFTLLDTNEDGQLSTTEHAAQTREIIELAHKKAHFKKMDTNNDGVLVPEELPEPGARLKAADTNGDGQVTKQEMRALRGSRAG